MTETPLLWFLMRGSGVVALVLLTVAVVLGVLSLDGRPGTRVPRFVVQAVHRNVALIAVVAVLVHVVTAVVDEFVDIAWWHALVPFLGNYEPLWLGLGALALDLLLVVTVTSLLRHRLRHRTWWSLHQAVHLLWLTSLLHGVGTGSDLDAALLPVTVGCAAAVAAAVVWRLLLPLRRPGREPAFPDPHDTETMPIRRLT